MHTYSQTFDADGSKKLINDDGTMNRRVLGGIVFADKKDMEKLNKIVWPVIADMAKHEIENIHTQHMAMLQEFKSSSPPSVCVICVEAAVLVEAGMTL